MQNNFIILLLVLTIIFLLYVYHSNQANDNITHYTEKAEESYHLPIKSNASVEGFPTESNKNKKQVHFSKSLDVREPEITSYYGSRIDTIDNTYTDKAMTNLLDHKPVTINQPPSPTIYQPVNQTDQNNMFNELENEIIKQYDEIYQKDGYFKSIERPNPPTAIANGEKTNSELNPAINLHAFEPSAADISGNKTVWELYDEMTTDNFKQYSNLDQLGEKENYNLYNIGKTNEYGSTAFDTYGL